MSLSFVTPSWASQYLVYNIKYEHPQDGYPKTLDDSAWRGLIPKKLTASFYLPVAKKLYFFQDGEVLRYTLGNTTPDQDYPRGLDVEFLISKNQKVDAALFEQKSSKLFLFFGEKYCEFDYKHGSRIFKFLSCKSIAKGFFGVKGPIQAATAFPNGKVYLFQGSQCYLYDLKKNRLDANYPRPINEFNWSGVWPSGVNASFYMPHHLQEGSVFFFKNTALTRVVPKNKNVVFLTLDGVRYEEFFNGTDPVLHKGRHKVLFKTFWEKHAKDGVVFGDPRQGSVMKINNATGISHPAYLNLFSGYYETECRGNGFGDDCPRFNRTTTFAERLVNELGIARKKVVTFSSWKRVEDAVEKVKGTTLFNGGKDPFLDPDFPLAHEKINHDQLMANGISNDPNELYNERSDIFTFRHAITYLKNHKPKFLYIHLAKTDTMGHEDDYPGLLKKIRWCDQVIDQIIQTLDGMGEYGRNTVLIITTDHGRGLEKDWTDHNYGMSDRNWKNVQKVWTFIRVPQMPGKGIIKHRPYSHAHLRPTMEALMGLQPLLGAEMIMKEVF